jgi:hypothetical protein
VAFVLSIGNAITLPVSRSRIPNTRKDLSSLQLSKELGITQKSAWFLLQRIREACSDDSGTKLAFFSTLS